MLERQRLDGAEILVVSPTPTWPLDHGNRKRIYSVCQSLKARGAIIHFLYYPSEGDWRQAYPKKAQREMQAQWDYYYRVIPSVALHISAEGDSHTIDEWWDEALENEIKWLVKRNRFQAIVVNYSWLSKALTLPPHDCLRVLDTHDRFSGRGALLEANGIEKEFFHTSQKEEFKALERADIVWAIKEEEAQFFRKLLERFEHEIEAKPPALLSDPEAEEEVDDYDYATTEVQTLLHVEDMHGFSYGFPFRDNGYLTVGIVGAYNNINLVNTREFLSKALPAFEKHMAPVKIILAGSMCQGLQDIDHPFVEMVGRLETMEAFYAMIDVALVPMTFSTGLKIKAGEALAYGVPLIAHEHAYEGYPVCHPWHALKSLGGVIDAVIDAAFDPEQLIALAAASQKAHQLLHQLVAQTVDHFADTLKTHRPNAVIVLPENVGGEYALRRLNIEAVADRLEEQFRLVLYFPHAFSAEAVSDLEHLSTRAIVIGKEEAYGQFALRCGMDLNHIGTVWPFSLLWNLSDVMIDKRQFLHQFDYFRDASFQAAGRAIVHDDYDVLVRTALAERYDTSDKLTWYSSPFIKQIDTLYKAMWNEQPDKAGRAVYILLSGTETQVRFWHKVYDTMLAAHYDLYWIIDSDALTWPIANRLNAGEVLQDFSLLKHTARCGILANMGRSDLLQTIAHALFVCKRRIYDTEGLKITQKGVQSLATLYSEMTRFVKQLDLNKYNNRFQHRFSTRTDFEVVLDQVKEKRLLLPSALRHIKPSIKVLVFIAVGRTGSNYLFSLLDNCPMFLNTYELFHNQCIYALEDTLDAFNEVTGETFEAICDPLLIHRVHHDPERLINFLKMRCEQEQKQYLTFKIFPEHLDRESVRAILERPDVEAFFIKRTPIDSYVSELKARQSGQWKHGDNTDVKPLLYLKQFIEWYEEKSQWYGDMEATLARLNKKAPCFEYEAFTRHGDMENLEGVLSVLHGNHRAAAALHAEKLVNTFTKQDKGEVLADKVANWDAFMEEVRAKGWENKMDNY